MTSKFNIPLTAERLTAYAIERQNGTERHQPDEAPSWMEQRRFWTDAILQGMARLEGRLPAPELMEWFDQRLESARGCFAVEPLPLTEQTALIRDLGRYISALEATGDDRRRQIAVAGAVLEDMGSHLPWDSRFNGFGSASPETLEQMRGRCIQEVKKTIGCITFVDAVKYQRGE